MDFFEWAAIESPSVHSSPKLCHKVCCSPHFVQCQHGFPQRVVSALLRELSARQSVSTATDLPIREGQRRFGVTGSQRPRAPSPQAHEPAPPAVFSPPRRVSPPTPDAWPAARSDRDAEPPTALGQVDAIARSNRPRERTRETSPHSL